jgi:hypothetical protein
LPVAADCRHISEEGTGFWDMTWGVHGYKDGFKCSIGGRTGVCDVTGQCYAYITPKDVAQELYAIYKDFEASNILAPTYLRTQRGCGAKWHGMKRGGWHDEGLA